MRHGGVVLCVLLVACKGGGDAGGATRVGEPLEKCTGALWAAGDDAAFAGGVGRVHRWDGATWHVIEVSGGGRISSVWGTAANDVWFVGDKEDAWHWNGSELKQVTLPNRDWETKSLAGRGGNGLITGHGGAMRLVNGAWTCWTADSCVVPGTSSGVPYYPVPVGDDHVWVAGSSRSGASYSPKVMEWNAGTWNDHSSEFPPGEYMRGGYASGPGDVWILGAMGIYHWDGTAWTTRSVDRPEDYQSIAGLDANRVWVGGAGGNVYAWNGSGWKVAATVGGREVFALHPAGASLWISTRGKDKTVEIYRLSI